VYAEYNAKFKYLPRHTVGCVFLGSPFRGTQMKNIADISARFMVLAGSHRGIIKDLLCDMPTQQDKLQEFCLLEQSLSIPLCCFFELYRTDYGKRFGIPGLFKGMV
jgi:hypothetical protein